MLSSAGGLVRVLGALALVAVATMGCADTSWEGTSRENTVAAYTRFLRDNPESGHAKAAEERIAFLRVMAHKTIEAHERFVQTYPNSPLAGELSAAMEPLYFERARSANTAAEYRSFLAAYPNGQLARRVKGDLAYVEMTAAVPDVASMREFLREFPESDFAADAQRSLDLIAFKKETTVKHLGIRVEVAPNAAQPQRVQRGFVSVVAREYRDHGIEVTFIPTGSEPSPDMQGWIRLDYDEAQASGTFGGSTILARCRVRLYNNAAPNQPIWDRTFEAPAEHLLKGTHGRDKTVFGNSRYPFWKQFFVPVSTWASTEARIQRLDYLEDVRAIDMRGDRIAVLFSRGGFDMVDVSSPLDPRVIDRYRRDDDLSSWSGIKLIDDEHVLIYGPDGAELVKRTAEKPVSLGKWEVPEVGAIFAVDAFDDTVLIAGNKGVFAIRTSSERRVAHRLLEGVYVGVDVHKPYIYLVQPTRVEVTSPKHLLRHLSGSPVTLSDGFTAKGSRIAGNSLMVFGKDEAVELSLANPARPQVVGRLDADEVGRLADLAADGERSYLLGDRGLQIADPSGRSISDAVQVRGSQAIARRGRYVFVAGDRTLEVVDVGPYQVKDYAPASPAAQ